MLYSIEKIAEYTEGSLLLKTEAHIAHLLTDSRAMSFPESTLFFAIKTARNDGHNYLSDLYRQGVRNFVVSHSVENESDMPEANFIRVNNTVEALQRLIIKHRGQFQIPVIGVTGSNGKTIVKEWLYQLLREDYVITRSPRSYNSQIGVPLSVSEINEQTQLGIFEAGISFRGEMEQLRLIVAPTIGIFTHLGDAHQENFTSLKEKCLEKLKLFKDAEVLIYQKDDKLIDITIAQSGIKARLFSWGRQANADVCIQAIKKEQNTTSIQYIYEGEKSTVEIPFVDEASVENCLHCLCVLLYLRVTPAIIAQRMISLEPVAMRLEVKEGINGCLIINDSYNSDISSLSIALDFLVQQSSAKHMSRTLVLSDIFQTGQNVGDLYSSVAQLIKSKGIDRLIGVGKELSGQKDIFDISEKVFYFTTDELLQSDILRSFNEEAILLKGSRDFHFEQLSEKIEAVTHETILEVDLNALVANLNYFRSFLSPETKVMCMVKAFAYGSGAIEVARTLQHHRCDYLAVAVADEGVELRKEGIHIPIVVMNPEKHSIRLIFEYQLEPEIYSFKLLDYFVRELEKEGITNYPIHLKIDSGMHRLGFEPQEMDMLADFLQSQKSVMVRSVFSHLAGADEEKFDKFTREQIAIFTTCADKIQQVCDYKIMRHILNSAGVERFPEAQLDMVRLGIGHYGISSIKGVVLQNVCTLKTTILQIKHVKAGETVGYSRKGVMQKDADIAILPIGYADGYDRRLGNGLGKVVVNGKKAPVVGNVCMDLIMIDVTGLDAKEGDKVVLFGEGQRVEEVASWLNTISYEVLTSVSRRVKRVYFQE
jgi:alanine racemase